MSNKKTQFGQSLTGDFEENTWTFEMLEDFTVSAGDFAIVPKTDFEVLITLVKRLKLAISKDEKAKINSEITLCVFKLNECLEDLV
jgi:hypothetical protein